MVPAHYNPISILIEKRGSRGHFISLGRMGTLYLVAAAFQCAWPSYIYLNWDSAKVIIDSPLFGWPFVLIWAGMMWMIPHLAFIGYRLIMISRDTTAIILQTELEKSRMRTIAFLLFLGILMDVTCIAFMFSVEDAFFLIFLSVLVGGRVLQANTEAVLQYHQM
ncbi:hypothetical protein H6788_02380 [Candidatus Nomurabacteria bacterium]|nr:hypothetical protein [Candidatus Nomurabacteria bacterium]MCB9819105.1 hypothetical protein [Candidatus Nomurabacteria bacterium]